MLLNALSLCLGAALIKYSVSLVCKCECVCLCVRVTVGCGRGSFDAGSAVLKISQSAYFSFAFCHTFNLKTK